MFIWNIVHMKFIWTMFFVNIQHIYLINILSTFLWFHICVLLLDMNFSIMLANILFWSTLGPLREDMVSLNTLRSCKYMISTFKRFFFLLLFRKNINWVFNGILYCFRMSLFILAKFLGRDMHWE